MKTIHNNIAIRFPKEIAEAIGIGEECSSYVQLAAALTLYAGEKVDPTNAKYQFKMWKLAIEAAEGLLVGNRDWQTVALMSGLDYYCSTRIEVDRDQAKSWLACLVYVYLLRYKELKVNATSLDAFGFGFFLDINDIAGISQLDDIAYDLNQFGGRPSLQLNARYLFEYTNKMDEEIEESQDEDDGLIEILIEDESTLEVTI